MKNIDLTVVVTAHNEGLVAHKTMLSVFEGLKELQEAGYTYEIIIHIDNGDENTKKYFSRYEGNDSIVILKNSFGDLGTSRNCAVSRACGEYVAFLDGDDLMSSNWYANALKVLKRSKEDVVVHPEAVLTFGIDQPLVLTIQKPSLSKDIDTLLLIGENRWGSVVMARKQIFVDNPYFKKSPGYNYEDYVFNIQTTERGIKHVIAKETVLFYRRSEDSMLSKGNRNHATIPFMKLFAYESIRNIVHSVEPKNFEENRAIRMANLYRRIRSNKVVNFLVTPVAVASRRMINRKPRIAKMVPDFVIAEWLRMNRIETQLYPYGHLINSVQAYSAGGQIAIGNAYCRIMRNIKRKYDYVFIVPWIIKGGAEKVLINYIKALSEIHPEWTFAIIVTLPSDNEWISKLSKNVDIVDFGNNIKSVPAEMQDTLFSRILIQLNCKNLHIINSEYGYRWMMRHKDLIKNHFRVTASLFAAEYIPGSEMKAMFSYDDPYLLELYDVLRRVYTDNERIISETIEKNGFDRKKFKVHYQPVIADNKKQSARFDDEKIHILWAGRIVNIKLPEIVCEIGRKLDKDKYVIDVYGEISGEVKKGLFDGIRSIEYHGSFSGFDSLMDKKFDLFLYTSLTDGIPNTILEAASYGIPIIASDDGGVGEVVINNQTGILINNPLDVDGYVDAIQKIADNEAERVRLSNNARKLVEERHSWGHFKESVKRDFEIED